MQTGLIQGAMYAKGFDAKTRSVEAVLSSDTIDGHGEIIDQATWRLARYLQNPVVLHMHSVYNVVGRAESIRVVDGQLQARIVFATTALAEEVATLFRDGAMRAFSVGFRPGRIEEIEVGGRKVRKLLDCELLEVSAVSIPSNPDAVVKHKTLGLVPANYTGYGSAADTLLRAAHEAAYGPSVEFATTGDGSADFLRAVEHRAGAFDQAERSPFDFDPEAA